MMDRRQFLLRGLLTTAGVTVIPPSQMWPFRKIFLPPTPALPVAEPISATAYNMDVLLEWDAVTGLYVIKGDKLDALYKTMVAGLAGRKA